MEKVNKIAVIGLGYVGLPLAIHFATCGFSVIGIDKDKLKIDQLAKGISYIPDVLESLLQGAVTKGNFTAFTPEGAVPLFKEVSYVIVAVPTPLKELENPDLGAIIHASDYIQKYLQKGQTIIFENFTYPGKLEEVILPILENTGKSVGKDFYLGYSPERIDTANPNFTMRTIPKVVSGQTEKCKEKVMDLYKQAFDHIVPVSSSKVKEAKNIVDTRGKLYSLGLGDKLKPSSFVESQSNEIVLNKIDEKPNSEKKQVVMYTAITNNYDTLKEVNYPSPDIDYIAFTDNKDLKSKTWKVIYLENLIMDNYVKTVKYYKMLPHIFLSHYQYSIWIDGSMNIKQDIQPLLEHLYQYPLTVFKHPERNCIYQEMEVCRMWNLDNELTMRKQMDLYRFKGYPKDNGLISSGVLLRQHNHPHVIKVMEDWWEEIFSHSKRDQLSFNYVAWKNGINHQTLKWQDLIKYFTIYPHIGKR